MLNTVSFVAFLLAAIPSNAQREDGQFWPCNPLKNATGACPANPGLNTKTYTIDFTKQTSIPDEWTISNYATVNFGPLGAEFTYNKRYDAPQLWTDFFILFGRVDVEMRVANGTGMISSAVLMSDVFDEIDFEFGNGKHWIGKGQNNYFGKGLTGAYDRGSYFDVYNPQTTFHTYSFDWTPERLNWLLDGRIIRTFTYADSSKAAGSMYQYPQTPSKFQLGIWAGGDPGQNVGTKDWAGGETDVNGGPYTMYVRKVTIQNLNPAAAYKYTDQSGRWQSIQLVQDEKPVIGASSSSASKSSSTSRVSSTSRTSTTAASTPRSSSTSSTARASSSTLTIKPSTTSTKPVTIQPATTAPSTKLPSTTPKPVSSTKTSSKTATTSTKRRNPNIVEYSKVVLTSTDRRGRVHTSTSTKTIFIRSKTSSTSCKATESISPPKGDGWWTTNEEGYAVYVGRVGA